MGFVNKVMLMGNTTRDPELRQLPSGSTVCDFAIATNRVYKTTAGEEKQETVFIDCTAFGRTAEVIAEYCPKGRALFVEGRLHFESWEDKQGNRRSKLSVIVESFQFIGSREPAAPVAQPGPARWAGTPQREPRGGIAGEASQSVSREPALKPGVSPEEPRPAEESARRGAPPRQAPGAEPARSPRKAGKGRTAVSPAGSVDAERHETLADADLPF